MLKKYILLVLFSILGGGLLTALLVFPKGEIHAASVSDLRQQLQQQLQNLENQIQTQESTISGLQKQGETFSRDINLLDQEIKKIKLELAYRELTVKKLTGQIQDRTNRIGELDGRLGKLHLVLQEYLKTYYTTEKQPIIITLFKSTKLSDFFSEVYAVENTQGKLQSTISDIHIAKGDLEDERTGLEENKSEEEQLKQLQLEQKKSLVAKETEKQTILKVTKGKESEFKKLVAKNRQTAATIRSQLFLLEGSPAISFEKAYEYATFAEKLTGVRAAFLLGTLGYESELGANVGKGNWQTDLANARCASQRDAFVKITSELGLNPDLMPVSKRQSYGYCGGAMGPAQFIPTTWLLYKDRISSLVGQNPPNPWDPKTAFVAAALLLKDNGAVGGPENERRAALKYLAGSHWSNPAYRFYGDNVMSLAADYQDQINILIGLASR